MNRANNQLLCCASVVLRLMLEINSITVSDEAIRAFRLRVVQAIHQFEAKAAECHLQSDEIATSKYAMTAMFDELILHANPSIQTQWMRKSLQMEFYGEHLAGEYFFQRLEALKKEAVENLDALEIYYVCLQLGFQGCYRASGQADLKKIIAELEGIILAVRGPSKNQLVPKALLRRHRIKPLMWRLPIWLVVIITFVLLVFIHFAFSAIIAYQAWHQIKLLHAALLGVVS